MSDEAAPAFDFGVASLACVDLQSASSSWPVSRRMALCMAIALHATAIWLLIGSATDGLGGGGHHLEAIGVDIVFSDVLDSREKRAVIAGAAAPVAAEQIGDSAEDAPGDAQKPVEEQRERELEVPGPAVEELMREETEEEPAKEAASETAAVAGGAAAESVVRRDGDVAPARSAAQAGAVNRFIAGLRSRLARTKPRGLRIKGVATVTFAIMPTGELAYARVSKSSGRQALDDAAVAAVRRAAPFPVPPPWMTGGELVFSIPYRFE